MAFFIVSEVETKMSIGWPRSLFSSQVPTNRSPAPAVGASDGVELLELHFLGREKVDSIGCYFWLYCQAKGLASLSICFTTMTYGYDINQFWFVGDLIDQTIIANTNTPQILPATQFLTIVGTGI
jgi:hypothetical protein